jgi:hypothetical protein
MRKRSWLSRKTFTRVTVHTSVGTFEGSLEPVAVDGLVLRAATGHFDNQPAVPLGEIFIPSEQVLFVQSEGD